MIYIDIFNNFFLILVDDQRQGYLCTIFMALLIYFKTIHL